MYPKNEVPSFEANYFRTFYKCLSQSSTTTRKHERRWGRGPRITASGKGHLQRCFVSSTGLVTKKSSLLFGALSFSLFSLLHLFVVVIRVANCYFSIMADPRKDDFSGEDIKTKDYYVRLRGLPFSAKEPEIRTFFDGKLPYPFHIWPCVCF